MQSNEFNGVEATIKRIGSAEATPMKLGRGITKHLAGPRGGAQRVDVHINVINEDSGIGPYHYHEKAENIYIVLDGVVEAIVDGKRFTSSRTMLPSYHRGYRMPPAAPASELPPF